MTDPQHIQAAGELTAALRLHYGPGPHPDGSPQAVHAGGQPKAPVADAPRRRQAGKLADIGGPMNLALLNQIAEFTRAMLHLGPGPHPAGSPQQVHGGDQMAFDFDAPAEKPLDQMSEDELAGVVARFKPIRQAAGDALVKLRDMRLDNVPDPTAATRWMDIRVARSKGAYAAEIAQSRPGATLVEVPFTPEERAALDDWMSKVAQSNDSYPAAREAKERLALLRGKRMVAKFPGKSSLSGDAFAVGAEILYSNTLDGKFAAPVSELSGNLRSRA